jgi:hypothetical protein
MAGLRGVLKGPGASAEMTRCSRNGHLSSIRHEGIAGCGVSHKRGQAAKSQGNGEKDSYRARFPNRAFAQDRL